MKETPKPMSLTGPVQEAEVTGSGLSAYTQYNMVQIWLNIITLCLSIQTVNFQMLTYQVLVRLLVKANLVSCSSSSLTHATSSMKTGKCAPEQHTASNIYAKEVKLGILHVGENVWATHLITKMQSLSQASAPSCAPAPTSTPNLSAEAAASVSAARGGIWAEFDSQFLASQQHRTTGTDTLIGIRRYSEERFIPQYHDPLLWWKNTVPTFYTLCNKK